MERTAKRKAETTKEVRNMDKQSEVKELKLLHNDLQCRWGYVNNSSYYKIFRADQLNKMISRLSFYIQDHDGDHGELLQLIRLLSNLTVEKSPANKKAVIALLDNLKSKSA